LWLRMRVRLRARVRTRHPARSTGRAAPEQAPRRLLRTPRAPQRLLPVRPLMAANARAAPDRSSFLFEAAYVGDDLQDLVLRKPICESLHGSGGSGIDDRE